MSRITTTPRPAPVPSCTSQASPLDLVLAALVHPAQRELIRCLALGSQRAKALAVEAGLSLNETLAGLRVLVGAGLVEAKARKHSGDGYGLAKGAPDAFWFFIDSMPLAPRSRLRRFG